MAWAVPTQPTARATKFSNKHCAMAKLAII
jgi:hypothetical protein